MQEKSTITHPATFLINSVIKFSLNQKHLGFILDIKLSFNEHINDKIFQVNKGLVSFKTGNNSTPYQLNDCSKEFSLIMPMWFMTKLPMHRFPKNWISYNVAPTITGTISDFSHKKIYQGLGLELSLSKKMGEKIVFIL